MTPFVASMDHREPVVDPWDHAGSRHSWSIPSGQLRKINTVGVLELTIPEPKSSDCARSTTSRADDGTGPKHGPRPFRIVPRPE
jgi:hypothetical protein